MTTLVLLAALSPVAMQGKVVFPTPRPIEARYVFPSHKPAVKAKPLTKTYRRVYRVYRPVYPTYRYVPQSSFWSGGRCGPSG